MLTVIAILLVVLPLFALATLVYDTLKIAELKRQKLRLKDEIERLKHEVSH